MDRHPTITGVVLTLNEEHDLARALRSLVWCDELLVVDSGSTDRTKEIAQQCGARFVEHIQSPPFLITKQRNWALDNAGLKSDWVLFLDADEEVGAKLADQIRLCIDSPVAADAYELTPRYWFLGKWLKRTQGYPNWHPRLVRRGRVHFEGGVWESFSDLVNSSRIVEPYEHYAFSKGLDDWLITHSRYADWEAKSIFSYLTNRNAKSFMTKRSLRMRRLTANIWPFRPLFRFAQKYVLQLGFTEGWQAFVFCSLMAFYEVMVGIKLILLIKSRGKDHSTPS